MFVDLRTRRKVIIRFRVRRRILDVFTRSGEVLDDDSDGRSKSKANIMESLSEDGNYVANIGNMVAGRVGNIFGKGIGGLSTKFGGGTSSWF